MGYYYDTYVKNPLADENKYLHMEAEQKNPPAFEEIKDKLPQPFWQNHDSVLNCYWKAWELVFSHIKQPTTENGFVSNYIATMFNDCLFMWDSVFAVMFGKYAMKLFNFQKTLDNFYAKQHKDGFICREISEEDGTDRFHRFDPSSTGPNIMPWAEWEYYKITGDQNRLGLVFPVLTAYHRWLRSYRTWPDGTYWSSGWGCGMDNQPRQLKQYLYEFQHGHMVWVDICCQQVLSGEILISMAEILGRSSQMDDFRAEVDKLTTYINEKLWDENTRYYYDMQPEGVLSEVMTIGAYWALLAGIVPAQRLPRFLSHLDNPEEFKRPHRVPSLPANNPSYSKVGNYWCGGVWDMTNYMVLKGLEKVGSESLAHEIAANHLEYVVRVFENTGTIWENYSAEEAKPGIPARPDFVGFGGITPIALLFENVFGLCAQVENSILVWDVRLLEEHGIHNYPFGNNGLLNLKCKARISKDEKPEISIESNVPLTLILKWDNGKESRRIQC